ncbi:MAG: DUF2783 domain-containing protein [Gammaproteobacteria bacterium]
MNGEDFETAYERLAAALDTVGRDGEVALLARLALLLANECPDLARFDAALRAALDAAIERSS